MLAWQSGILNYELSSFFFANFVKYGHKCTEVCKYLYTNKKNYISTILDEIHCEYQLQQFAYAHIYMQICMHYALLVAITIYNMITLALLINCLLRLQIWPLSTHYIKIYQIQPHIFTNLHHKQTISISYISKEVTKKRTTQNTYICSSRNCK